MVEKKKSAVKKSARVKSGALKPKSKSKSKLKPKSKAAAKRAVKKPSVTVPTIEELAEAGVHFGHQRRRWHPRMAPFIFSEQNGIHIFDLAKTRDLLLDACQFLSRIAKEGGSTLFVGTKRQSKDIVLKEAQRAKVMFITDRWIGGLLTNFTEVKKNLAKLKSLKEKRKAGEFAGLTKREQVLLDREIVKLEKFYGGIVELAGLPDALVLTSGKKEKTALREAKRAGVKMVILADSNVDPESVDYPIPGNDDSRKSIALIVKTLADAVIAGRKGRKA